MAQYSTTFTGQAAGSDPTEFTSRWNATTSADLLSPNVGEMGGAVFEFPDPGTSSSRQLYSYDAANDQDGTTEILCRFRTTHDNYGNLPVLILRGSGSGGAETGYACAGLSDGKITLYRYLAGATDGAASTAEYDPSTSSNPWITQRSGGHDFTALPENEWLWVRFQVSGVGATVTTKARWWVNGQAEGGTWLLEYTDSSVDRLLTGGYSGVGRYSSQSGSIYYDTVSVGTVGDAAPLPTITPRSIEFQQTVSGTITPRQIEFQQTVTAPTIVPRSIEFQQTVHGTITPRSIEFQQSVYKLITPRSIEFEQTVFQPGLKFNNPGVWENLLYSNITALPGALEISLIDANETHTGKVLQSVFVKDSAGNSQTTEAGVESLGVESVSIDMGGTIVTPIDVSAGDYFLWGGTYPMNAAANSVTVELQPGMNSLDFQLSFQYYENGSVYDSSILAAVTGQNDIKTINPRQITFQQTVSGAITPRSIEFQQNVIDYNTSLPSPSGSGGNAGAGWPKRSSFSI